MFRVRLFLASLLLLSTVATAASAATARLVTRVIAAGDTVSPPPPEPPPPPPPPLRGPGYWITQILIQSAAAPGQPICPGDSIRVILRGAFPDGCRRHYRIELLPSLEATPLPNPPLVRFVVTDSICENRICSAVLVPWEAHAILPALPVRDYQLHLLFDHESCTDSILGSVAKDVPFVVQRCGVVQDSCLRADWDHPNGPGQCDAEAGPGRQAKLDFRIHTPVALAGLQGEFAVEPSGLAITQLEPIGAASGMLLTWTPTGRGAKFVLVSPRGAPIVPTDPRGSAVLRVTATRPPNEPIPDRTHVTAPELLGSTAEGDAVPMCSLVCAVCRFAPAFAVVCAPRNCDVNADGRSDVRDLVLMVRCLHDSLCGNGNPRHFDCDRDSDFDVSDVICCARHILRPAVCPDCPPDTGGSRPGDGVAVRIGSPTATAAGFDVPVILSGAGGLGAARIGLTFPADRWEVTGVDYPHPPAAWLSIDDAGDGELALGWVRFSLPGVELGITPLEAVVHLRLKPGQTAAGEIAVASGDFSAPDGVKLDVELGHPVLALGGPATLELAANRPNPFARETRFSVTLDRGANVELGVYDVGGRLVATIHRGRLAPGPHEFVWNGRDDAGKSVRGGMYFYRATADGRIYSRKMVLLGTQ